MTTIGRYSSTRPRGFHPWEPRRKTLQLLDQVRSVLDEFSDYLPVTLRQVFYRLVGAYGYVKSDGAYFALGEMMVRARRAGMVPFGSIRDDRVTELWAGGVHGPEDFWRNVRDDAAEYRRERMADQTNWVEVWCESGGMAPQLYRVAREYGIPVFSSGGFGSVTSKHDVACRLAGECRPSVLVSIGDMDPSGISIFDSFAEDVSAFYRDMTTEVVPQFVRAAVTPEQVERYDLPEAPVNRKDNRGAWEGGTVQAEALSPKELATELRAVLGGLVDLQLHDQVLQEEQEERDSIMAHVEDVL